MTAPNLEKGEKHDFMKKTKINVFKLYLFIVFIILFFINNNKNLSDLSAWIDIIKNLIPNIYTIIFEYLVWPIIRNIISKR